MELWLFKRTEWGYDEYDSDLVAAESEDAARKLSFVAHCRGATAQLIGMAQPEIEAGTVIASFNAG